MWLLVAIHIKALRFRHLLVVAPGDRQHAHHHLAFLETDAETFAVLRHHVRRTADAVAAQPFRVTNGKIDKKVLVANYADAPLRFTKLG